MPLRSSRQNHINQIRQAIDFAQADLAQFSEGDWLNLKQRFFDFLTAEMEWSFGVNAKALRNNDVIVLGRLIEEAETQLSPAVVDDIGDQFEEEDQKKVLALHARNLKRWTRVFTPEDAKRLQGDLRERLNWFRTEDGERFLDFSFHPSDDWVPEDWLSAKVCARLQLYLIAAGIERLQLRTCPECKQLFLKQTKPEPNKIYYCTHRCAQIVASRAYRERHQSRLRLSERERKRRSYVEKQRRIHGPRTKVGRRPRAENRS